MHQSIDKKSKLYIYLFLLFFLTTFNNFSLINSEYFKLKINQIKVTGLSDENNFKILTDLDGLILENIFFINKYYFLSILEKNNLIHSFKIKKIYPNSIEVKIKKTDLLAITNIDGNFFFIGSNGKLINYDFSHKNLPYIFGTVKANDFVNFAKIIEQSKFNFKEISEIYFFPSGRWDIKNKDGKLFMLSKKNLLKSLNLAYRIINNEKFKNSQIIDLRVLNHIVLTDE
jgi:cell division protein FtsQ